jgi:hypothetical protein
LEKDVPKKFGAQFIKTLEVCESKAQYYELLAKAKVAVSTAEHETFGISMVEAAWLGCFPVVPDSMSYPETIPKRWRYKSYKEMLGLVIKALDAKGHFRPTDGLWLTSANDVVDEICQSIKEMFDGATPVKRFKGY